jgi:hypothetical protein
VLPIEKRLRDIRFFAKLNQCAPFVATGSRTIRTASLCNTISLPKINIDDLGRTRRSSNHGAFEHNLEVHLFPAGRSPGCDKFNMGLPGNLVTVALKDYVHKDPDGHHSGGVRADNADGFQNYENGGATGCFAFFTLAALYDLGRRQEADRILFAMLGEYDQGGFEGRGALGRSNDWRRWDGTPMGYEGFLVDNYYTLLAVPLRQQEQPWKNGDRPATLLP